MEEKNNNLSRKVIINDNNILEYKKQLQNKEKEIHVLNEIISKLKMKYLKI